MEGGNKSSSTQKKWRLLLVVHRASQIIVSSSKADKADHKALQDPTEIVQVLPTSTDHSQVSIDVSFEASNGIPGDEKHLCPRRRIDKEGQAHPAHGFLEKIKELPEVTSKSSTSSLDHGDLESQTQRTGNKSSSTSSTQKKWRLLLVVHRARRIIVSSSKADKANLKASHENVGCAEDITGEPTEIVQVLPTSTDHSQVSINVSFDASNDDVDENLKIQHETVAKIVKSRNLKSLQSFGGVNRTAQALRTDLHKGIPGDEKDVCSRRHIDNNHILFQGNAPAAQRFLKVLLRCCNSSVIFFLSVSAVLSIGFGIDEKGLRTGWYEGCIITLGIIVLVVLSSTREFLNEKQNKKQKRPHSQVMIDVLRGGNWQKISISDVVLGDIVGLRRGYEVPGDGLFISGGFLKLDDGLTTTTIDDRNPFMYYGSKVINGDGHMLVTSVGMNTALGEMMSQVSNEPAGKITFFPAQIDKLSNSTQIIGLSISILIPVVLFLRFKFGKEHDHHDSGAPDIKGKSISIQVLAEFINRISLKQSGCVNVLTTSLTLLVVGFAEGVPFIVTLAIIYWNKKALCDKGYVKESLACVGMGSVTTICTGKTGGLTLSSEVVEVLWIDEQVISEETVIDTSVVEALCNGISALVLMLQSPGSSIGNPFLPWATSKLGLEPEILKESCTIIDSKEIGSWKDGSRVLMRRNGDEESHVCLHRSGSAKTIIAKSSHYYDCKGTVNILDEHKRSAFHQNIQHMRSKDLKMVAFAHKMVDNYPNFDGDNSLILIGLIGLKHICPVETRKAVKAFKDADVNMILISEDDVSELKDIGREFGLLNGQERQVVHGEEFRILCDEERKVMVERICVIGNCLPYDKLLLVQCLKQNGHVVAMVGNRTNDIPALKEANLGIAMGIGSSELAKECSDIIISVEDFNSLVTILSCGRCAYNNINKYIQFEITMFVAWLLVTTITTAAFGDAPVTTIQWFWVNLIVSIPSGLVLLTEQPLIKKTDPLITKSMWRNIITQALFQAAILVTFQLITQTIRGINIKVCKTMIFNIFVLFQVFNLFKTIRKPNLLEGIYRNLWFRVAVDVILLLQLAFIEIAHKLVGNAQLNGEQWGICFLIGMLSLLSDFAAKSITTLFKYCCLRIRGSHTDSAGMTHSSESTSNLELPLINSESQIP
ncbi:hypothetical protein LWI29_027686 [Acer saccharum]|uniref:Calcium-transporting ATPase n=1 Tax=Acer saccharum TaxID=4024 RepID=A0AA39SND6_ACESA|nr:hypothetical protein LWI29_027686 [Acer saccharum]